MKKIVFNYFQNIHSRKLLYQNDSISVSQTDTSILRDHVPYLTQEFNQGKVDLKANVFCPDCSTY